MVGPILFLIFIGGIVGFYWYNLNINRNQIKNFGMLLVISTLSPPPFELKGEGSGPWFISYIVDDGSQIDKYFSEGKGSISVKGEKIQCCFWAYGFGCVEGGIYLNGECLEYGIDRGSSPSVCLSADYPSKEKESMQYIFMIGLLLFIAND